MADCRACGRKLTGDEIAVTRKLIGLCETSFYCKSCLAAYFHCGEDVIDWKIRQFREAGCYLFPDLPEENTVREPSGSEENNT